MLDYQFGQGTRPPLNCALFPVLKLTTNRNRNMTAVDMNLSLDQALPSESKYLSKNDVITPLIATIRSFQYDELTAGEGEKLIVLFENDIKPLVLK